MSGLWVQGKSNGGARRRRVVVVSVAFAVRVTGDVKHRRFVGGMVLVKGD